MSAAFSLWDALGTTAHHRYQNTTGSVVSAMTRRLDGRELPDQYTLTLSGVSGGTGTVTVTCGAGTLNYHQNRTKVVNLDSTTSYKDVVDGVDLKFASGGANGDVAVVYAGRWLGVRDAGNPSGNRLNESTGYNDPGEQTGLPAGTEVYLARVKVKNETTQLATGCKVVIKPPFHYRATAGAGLLEVDCVGEPTAKIDTGAGNKVLPYAVTFANLDTAATPDEIDVLFGGSSTWSLIDTMTGTALTSTLQLKRDGTTKYQFTAGALIGVTLIIDAAAGNSDTGELRIWPEEWLEIAPDSGGSPGAWGTSDVTLTQSGQPTGEIASGQGAFYWERVTIPSGAAWARNPHPFNPRVEARLAGTSF